jgi:hypothetical protein
MHVFLCIRLYFLLVLAALFYPLVALLRLEDLLVEMVEDVKIVKLEKIVRLERIASKFHTLL